MKILLLLLGIVAAILAASIEHDETSLTQEVVAAPARVVRSAEPGNKKKKSLKKGKGKNRKNKGKKQLKKKGKKKGKKAMKKKGKKKGKKPLKKRLLKYSPTSYIIIIALQLLLSIAFFRK